MRIVGPILFTFMVLFGCSNKTPKKPKNLIPMETMEQVLYDVYMLNAIKISNKKLLQKEEVSFQNEIFDKYQIDSLQFVDSNNFYASDFESYSVLIERIKMRMNSNKKEVEQLVEHEKENKKGKKD